MARQKKKTNKPQWRFVAFGVIVFVGLGLGLLTTFKAGANEQLNSMHMVQNVNYISH